MKQFTGSNLSVNPDKSAVILDSGYDCFDKKTTINVPEGFTAVFLQNGKYVCSGTGTFTVASRKKSGLKIPLFGGKVKTELQFFRTKYDYVMLANNKRIKVGGRDAKWNTTTYYTLELKNVAAWLRFAKDLKLTAREGGLIANKNDIGYIMETVLPQYLKPGSAGFAVRARTATEKTYLAFLEDIFLKKLCQPFGFACTKFSPNSFSVE